MHRVTVHQGISYFKTTRRLDRTSSSAQGWAFSSIDPSHIHKVTGYSLSKFIFPGTRGQVPIVCPGWASPDIGCFSIPFFFALAMKSTSCISKEDTSPMRHPHSTFLYDTTLSLHIQGFACHIPWTCYRHHLASIYTASKFQIGFQTAHHSLYTPLHIFSSKSQARFSPISL